MLFSSIPPGSAGIKPGMSSFKTKMAIISTSAGVIGWSRNGDIRVELGEIEAGLYSHPDVKEAAVIAMSNEENGVQIKAFLSFTGGQKPFSD